MSYPEVKEALERISKYIHRTPIHTNSYINSIVGRNVFFKCENFQKTGSFKARGALNAVLKLKEQDPASAGVATHSSGNHAQALGWAARSAGLPCSVIVPNNCPQVKREAIKGYGSEIFYCEPNPVSRLETCTRVAKEKGQTMISSSDTRDVMVGQGTLAVEFLEEVPQLDALFVCASGGGMTAGCAVAVKGIKPECKVFVVEPKGKDLGPCMQTGKRLWPNPPQYVDTVADGIRVQQISENNFPIFLELVEKEVFTVDNKQIIEATRLVWQRMKLVVETSAGASVAAVLSDQMKGLDPSIKNVGVVLCGGNIDLDDLPWNS